MRRGRFWGFSIPGLFIVGALISFSAVAQADEVSFHIAARPLAEALVDLALQAKLSIGYASIDFHDALGNPVEGRFQPDAALKLLLAGTGYESVLLNDDTILIRQADLTQPNTDGPPAIEEIIVTTTKRAEFAQSLPYSIMVISGSQLKDLGAEAPNDLQMHVAALSATNLGPGQDKLAIRGLSDSAFAGRSQSMVGLYLDESRLTDDAPDPGLRLVDINRIEIVRGPQGTLYGAGALGGLIRIITNQPVLDREEGMIAVTTAATEHGAPSGGVDAMLNVPIVDNILGIRLVGYVKRDGGYIDDTRLNLRNINQTDTTGGRATLLWQPLDDWTVTAGVTNQLIDAADSQYAQGNLSPLTRANYEREPYRDAFLQASLTIEGSFDWVNVTSTTAFTKRRIADQLDATLAWQALTGYRIGPSTFDDVRRIQSVTHETRLTSVGNDDFSWIAGIFVSHRDEDYHSVLTGPDANRAPYQARVEARTDHADDDALFGEATYRLFDFLSLTGGARIYHSTLDAAAQVGQPSVGGNTLAQGQNRVTGVIPKAIVSVNAADNLTFYADATEGFRLGGVNINSPIGAINVNKRKARLNVNPNAAAFDSDRLWSYEVGAKTSFFDRTLVVNTAAYYTVWDNIQSDQILRDGSLYTSNAGGAHVPGFEVDLDMRVTQHLRLQGNFFWNDPQIVHSNPLLVQSVGRLPAVAKSNLGLSGRYDIPLGGDWNASTSLEYSYVGPSTLGFDAVHSPSMGDYFIGNLRLGLTHDSWEAVLFVNNIANEQANTFAFGNPFSLTAASQITPLRPRTLGLSISASY